jgi:hypothetical protein
MPKGSVPEVPEVPEGPISLFLVLLALLETAVLEKASSTERALVWMLISTVVRRAMERIGEIQQSSAKIVK